MISNLKKPGCASKQHVLELATLRYVSCKSIPSQQNSYRITLTDFLIGKTDGFASKCDSKIDSQWLRNNLIFFLNCFFYPMWSKLWLNCGWEWPLLSKMLKLAVDTETGLGVTWFWLFLSCLVLFFFFKKVGYKD